MNDNNPGPAFDRSPCPVTNVLDLFGDKWTLLVVRDLMLGKTRYGEFARSPEGIPTNILANRLRQLEQAGVVERNPYCGKPLRYEYELTAKGRDLKPILEAMADWASNHVPGTRVFSPWQRPEGIRGDSSPKPKPQTSGQSEAPKNDPTQPLETSQG